MARDDSVDMWQDIMKAPPPPAGPPRWLLSFVDLTGILVAFFVLMFSMKELDVSRWEQVQQSMQKAFKPSPTAQAHELPASRLNATRQPAIKNDGIVYLQQLLERRLQGDPFWGTVHATVTGNAFELPLPPALFNEATVTPAGNAALLRLAEVIRNWDNPLYVAVHTAGKARWRQLPAAMALQRGLTEAGVGRLDGVVFLSEGAPTTLTLRVEGAQ